MGIKFILPFILLPLFLTSANASPAIQFMEANKTQFIDNMISQANILAHTWVDGYRQCSQPIDELHQQLNEYSNAFLAKDYGKAEVSFTRIKSILSHKDSCSETIWSTYMVMSSLLGTQSPKDYINQQTYRNEQTILTVVLANKGKLKVLTPKLREELKNLNGAPIWVEKSADQFVINGFYDCKNSTIFLSDDLRPFDMAAAIYHEIDHLYRDKFFRYDNIGWSAFEDEIHFRSYLAFDEVLATVRGGFFQRRALRFMNLPGNHHSQAQFDWKFFNDNGPLTRIIDKFDADPGLKMFKHNSAGNLLMNIGRDEVYQAELEELLEIITTGYFGKPTDEFDLFKEAFSGITSLFGQKSIGDTFIESHFYYLSHAIHNRPDPWGHLIQVFTEWVDHVDNPTPLCEKVIKTQTGGELDDYIGTKMANGGHGGNSGIRPCLKIRF